MSRKIKTGGNIKVEALSPKEEVTLPIEEKELTETEKAIKEAEENKKKREEILVDFTFKMNYFDRGTLYSAGEIIQLPKNLAEKYKELGFGG